MPVPVNRSLVGSVEAAELELLLANDEVVGDHDWERDREESQGWYKRQEWLEEAAGKTYFQ